MLCLAAIRQIEIVEQTYYRWLKQYGGMGVYFERIEVPTEGEGTA